MDAYLRALERAVRLGDDDQRLRARAERERLRAGLAVRPSLADFIRASANELAHDLVAQIAARRDPAGCEAGHVFFDGATGTGKTHLLRALHAARADAWLWSGVELHERAARAIEQGVRLDAPRLLLVDDLTSAPPALLNLLARSLSGATLVAAGRAVKDAFAALGGRLVSVGPLDARGRRELFDRALSRLGSALGAPDELPPSGFEIEGLARNLALRSTT